MLNKNETAKKLSKALGIESLEQLDVSPAELKRLLSEFRHHIRERSGNVRTRRYRPPNAGHTVLYAVDERRVSFALHHGLLPGCVCKCRMEDADSGRIDAMECLYAL
jgi:hypothetical protein